MVDTVSPTDCSFKLLTEEIAAFTSLFLGLRELLVDVRLYISKTGLTIRECFSMNHNYISFEAPADRFLEYHASGDIALCFEPKLMYQCLANHTIGFVMEWKLVVQKSTRSAAPHHKNYYLSVVCMSTNQKGTSAEGTPVRYAEYKIPLREKSESTTFVAQPRSYDHLMKLSPSDLVGAILEPFGSLQAECGTSDIEIRCTSSYIAFSLACGPGSKVAKMECIIKVGQDDDGDDGGDSDDGDDGGDSDASKTSSTKAVADADAGAGLHAESDTKLASRVIKSRYSLVYLLRLSKCFTIDKRAILVYIKEDHPIVFKVHVGDIGHLSIVVMYKTEDTDDADDFLAQDGQQSMPPTNASAGDGGVATRDAGELPLRDGGERDKGSTGTATATAGTMDESD